MVLLFCIRKIIYWCDNLSAIRNIIPWYILLFSIFFLTLLYLGKRKLIKKKYVLETKKHSQQKWSSDVIIVGSGVVGSAMATVLAQDGRSVTVIERDMKEPNRIVGELLQPGGVKALHSLGLQDCLTGFDACHVLGYVIHDLESKNQVQIPYLKDEKNIFEGRSFHHGRFIMKLRQAAQNQSRVNYIEGTVTKLIEENDIVVGISYSDRTSQETKVLKAPLTIVCDGCFSRFRKSLIKSNTNTVSHFVGTIMKNYPQFLTNYAELVLATPSPILIYKISNDETRVLIDIPGKIPGDTKQHMIENVAPQLPDHLKAPFLDAIYNEQLRSMPNSFLPPSSIKKPGVIILGDAYNMRHPLTGGGMTVAFNDVLIWRELLQNIPDLEDYHALLKAARIFQNKRKYGYSFVVNVLAQALYKLFSASDEHMCCLKRACFQYFKLGGECVKGPVGLLSVITPKPSKLIGHFFAVAFYAIYFIFKNGNFWALHYSLSKSLLIFLKACVIIFPLVWTEVKTILIS